MNLRQAAQQALEALIPLANAGCPNERECLTDEDHERATAAVEALEQALAEPEQKAKPITNAEMSAWVKDTWEKCQAEAWQKPVAYFDPQEKGFYWAKPTVIKAPMTVSIKPLPLYSAPTPRKPLSEDEIVRLMVGEDRAKLLSAGEFAEGAVRELVESGRAIERAHGIGEQNGS